jgi:uncharacterized protein (TIGR00297 family)
MTWALVKSILQAASRTVTLSSVVAALTSLVIVTLALGMAGALILVIVVIGATAVSALPNLAPHARNSALHQEPRTWKNFAANAGVATAVALWSFIPAHPESSTIAAMFAGSLSAGLSDTVSHEAGVFWGGTPRMLTTFKPATTGEDGAVSLVGTITGFTTSYALTAVAAMVGLFGVREAVAAGTAGCVGNLADSLLGATLQRRGWLGNNAVNFCSTALGALASFALLA